MTDYTLYYWPAPFRGEFVRAVLAHAGQSWDEPDPGEVAAMKDAGPADQPVPHMAPPMLRDNATGTTMAQMPAILTWLGERHGLLPDDPLLRAKTAKILGDINDILDEVTRHGGETLWSQEGWAAYRPRLIRWMEIFEATGRGNGLQADSGDLLGAVNPTLADICSAILWVTMADRLPGIRALLERAAPRVLALSDRIAAGEAIAAMRRDSAARFGQTWCGGQIERSLREVLG